MAPTIELASYLFTRLRQLGVESIHGVPGDYNLALLDYVEPSGLHWVGNCNELNAGYAADGYSRIKRLGALITTFGVGELSAANAIAGAYAELAPVVHIVGTPARQLQDSRARIHHTFNDGNFRRFALMHRHITIAQASLWDSRTSPSLIDSTLQQCLMHSRPVYIEFPSDMVSISVDASQLEVELRLPDPIASNDENLALAFVLDRMYSSKQPMLLIDGESHAYDIVSEIKDLIKLTQWPTFTSVFGKSLVNESLPNFRGIWMGSSASLADQEFVKSSDLIIVFGPHFSTTNSFRSTSIPDPHISILVQLTSVVAGDKTFRDVPAKQFISLLLKHLDPTKIKKPIDDACINGDKLAKIEHPPNDHVTQDKFYHTLSPFLRVGDIILGETGTAGHGCRDLTLPPQTHLFKPSTWLSIGYMLPAAQGAALAQRELDAEGKWPQDPARKPPRTILLIGDGSFQMTAQELSTIIREKLNVIIFLINNAGYTIERCLHGWNQKYNDIASWRYLLAPAFFGADESNGSDYPVNKHAVRTWGALQSVLDEESGRDRPGLSMVEVFMDRDDAPGVLKSMLEEVKMAEKI